MTNLLRTSAIGALHVVLVLAEIAPHTTCCHSKRKERKPLPDRLQQRRKKITATEEGEANANE